MKKDGTILRVLIVDEEPLILWGLSRFFKKSAIVKTVSTAEEAFNDIGAQQYDLCFLDVILPGVTGLEAMKIINERSPSTKVAIMSGSFIDETIIEQIKDIAYAFIEKPFDISYIKGIAEMTTVALN
ncbi:response regulator [Thermodesulfobacteriota bacterium]